MSNTSIVVCGQKFDIGTRVVLWDEKGGLNGYDESKHTVQEENRQTGVVTKKTISGKRYGKRSIFPVDITKLKDIVTQFFLHHSGLYHSGTTFEVLHNERKLSVHFILDDDGTLYQTLDLVECAWHGGKNNGYSVGIEVDSRALADKVPDAYNKYNCDKYKVTPHKSRFDKLQKNFINGYEFTDKQYETLIRLGKGLMDVFPKINSNPDFPRDAKGRVIKEALLDSSKHCGFICHYHASANKIDPISFDYQRFLLGIKSNNPFQAGSFVTYDDWRSRQIELLGLGYDPGPIDGVFGSKTNAALRAFQKDNGINESVWGQKTDFAINWHSKRS
jgi:hypothetical protein